MLFDKIVLWKLWVVTWVIIVYLFCPVSLTSTSYPPTSNVFDSGKNTPPGTLVDVGGYRLHMYCTGSDAPAVILDSGLGGISTDWELVQGEIAKFTTVVSYDRAGIAWSEVGPLPRTSKQIVKELHSLLANANIPKPYILVGHSFGGNNVQLYAATYPNEVLGIVLVDSSHEEQGSILPPHPLGDLAELMQNPEDRSFKSTFGMSCFVTQLYLNSKLPFLPESMQNARLTVCSSAKHCHTITSESESFPESLTQLARADRSCIKNKPCFVLTMGQATDLRTFGLFDERTLQKAIEKQKAWQHAWKDLQRDLVSKFNRVRQVIAKKSDHAIIWNQPELIIQAVENLIEESREPNDLPRSREIKNSGHS